MRNIQFRGMWTCITGTFGYLQWSSHFPFSQYVSCYRIVSAWLIVLVLSFIVRIRDVATPAPGGSALSIGAKRSSAHGILGDTILPRKRKSLLLDPKCR